ncbi:MAG: molybdenum cofactor biosynthesis protein MoaE [Hyphomicrobiales bacterium]|uniref:molybdenum cofactor biosynthesis protein MoaE n=1 Tax=Nisaea sp. TaxID=2024842 RepID=UPI003284A58B
MSDKRIRIAIQTEPFDIQAEINFLSKDQRDVGAVVTFTGICRQDNSLQALELEHYPGMAENELHLIVEEAFSKWPLQGAVVVHRVGKLEVSEHIVLVATASSHRHAAFDSANFIMDYLKSKAPFWKKEHPQKGSAGNWVDAKESDQKILGRWRAKTAN